MVYHEKVWHTYFTFLVAVDNFSGVTMAQWLSRWTSDRTVRVRALAGAIVLCSWAWARQFTLIVPLSTQVVIGGFTAGGNPAMD